jgi:hypothetical protein
MNNKLLILIIILVFISYSLYHSYLHFKQEIPWKSRLTSHILFTRYKEPDMSRVLKPFINKNGTTVFIYNKGDDIPTGIPDDATNVKIINIPNLGWDSYGFILHIINNYYDLPDYIYNLHASAQYLDSKYTLFLDLLDPKYDSYYYYGGKLHVCDLGFYLNDWNATYKNNREVNLKQVYTHSKIRPLNNWLLTKIPSIPPYASIHKNYILHNWGGMFFVHRSKILNYPLLFYTTILNEISVWQSEVNHYLERSWYILYGKN